MRLWLALSFSSLIGTNFRRTQFSLFQNNREIEVPPEAVGVKTRNTKFHDLLKNYFSKLHTVHRLLYF